LNQSDAVTTVSDYLRAETQRVLGFVGKLEVIHNFYSPRPPRQTREQMRHQLGLRDEVVIFHASNLRPLKRIDLLLEIVARLRPRGAFKLLVLAGGSFAPFEKDVKLLGLEDRIIVRENVSGIEDFLQVADVGLFTSEVESFCLSILEAMCFACPSVARRVGGIPEVVEHNQSGILVSPEDTDGLVEAVQMLVRDPKRRLELGQAARQRAQEQFSAGVIVPRYESLYASVAHGS
jgi:N-acetyl-alpha-D-glucosaminyl L-malate synthase BshA